MEFCDECYVAKDELCPKCHDDFICPDCEDECFWCWMKANGNCDDEDDYDDQDDFYEMATNP